MHAIWNGDATVVRQTPYSGNCWKMTVHVPTKDPIEAGQFCHVLTDFSTDPLLRRIADWTDAAFAGRVRAIVVDGAPVPLDPSTFEPCLEMRSEEAAAFDLGFDLEASRSAKETRGVRTGSAAERAGLRDGLPLLRCSITFGQADVPVEVGVRDAGAERTIRWLPRGESSPVAKLVPREGASAQDCSRL